MRSVYLAGPMKGRTKEEMVAWRIAAAAKLQPLEVFSPLQGVEHLFLEDGTTNPRYKHHPLRQGKAFTRVDFYYVRECDAILVNFLGASAVSIGSVMEIAVAHEYHKLVIVVMEKNNVHRYPMIEEYASIVVADLNEAIEYIRVKLLPGYAPSS